MSAEATALSDRARGKPTKFILRKLHSLSGVVPVGIFLVLHLWTSSSALEGQASFDAANKDARGPYQTVLQIVLVLFPLFFHALYGVKIALEGRQNTNLYPYARNWMYAAQRVTGIAALAFIIWHLSEYWIPRVSGAMEPEAFYPALCENLSATRFGIPLAALGYVFGIAACVFHFANGLWGFCLSWGITVSRRAQRLSATVFGLSGLVLFLLGANTAIYFATGSRVAVFGVPSGSTTAQLVRTCPDLQPRSPAQVPQPAPLPPPPVKP